MPRARSTLITGALIATAAVLTLVAVSNTQQAHAQAGPTANCTPAAQSRNAVETWMAQQLARGRANFVAPGEYLCAW